MILFHKSYKAADLVGKKIKLRSAIKVNSGFEIPEGTICEIINARHNLTIRYCCSHCGVKVDVSGIARNADYLDLFVEEQRS